ncbi:MAG: LOG family protein, partial [Bacteroidetes bacterium]|nr:LOG family protein [Bacteroidota bacterium]
MRRICVFCGSSMGNKEEYKKAAKRLGKYMVKKDIELIYGGANVGLMKIIADEVLSGEKKVIGIMPHLLIAKEVEHKGISELISVETMAERKELMANM